MTVRIPPLATADMSDAQKELVLPYEQNGHIENVFRTMAQHPDLFRRWGSMIRHVLFKSTLPFRDREILILRIGFLCRAEYEWAQHVQIGRKAGLGEAEIDCIMKGEGLCGHEETLLHAADELWEDARIGDQTWAKLAAHYRREQLMDIVFTVGQYNLVSMALNSFGVELDAGIDNYPRLPSR